MVEHTHRHGRRGAQPRELVERGGGEDVHLAGEDRVHLGARIGDDVPPHPLDSGGLGLGIAVPASGRGA